MQAPSVTNRFFTSWHWFRSFSTEVAGSRPMRAVPISWIVRPGALSWTNGSMSLALTASSTSPAVAAQEVGVRARHIAEARHVYAVGTPSVDRPVLHPRDDASRPAPHTVVHEILAQLAT